MALWLVDIGGVSRLALGPADGPPEALLGPEHTVDSLLRSGKEALAEAAAGPGVAQAPPDARVLAPVGGQEVWAAGVTYERSRDARVEESETPDHYERVYDADRPELFVKASPGRVRATGEPIGIRADSSWDVPEPELGVVVDSHGEVAGYLLGNDVSSRSIEGDNPLYLPQAKVYDGSCALGPCLVPASEAPDLADMRIAMAVTRSGAAVFRADVDVRRMHRTVDELVDWLFLAQSFPVGVVLLTGTAIVPDPDFTLQPGDFVTISLDGLGSLTNTVELVGAARPRSAPMAAR
jgi:2-dehydro-3-deoxy-D-arabinonate dehydratase